MKKYILPIFMGLLLSATISAQKQLGSIMGTIVDDGSGDKVEQAKIVLEIEGAHVKQVFSDPQGAFHLLNVLEGDYDLVIMAMGYPPMKITGVPVKALDLVAVELVYPGESFSTDTIFYRYEEVKSTNTTGPNQNGGKKKKERLSCQQKRLIRAASKLDDN